MQASNRNSIVFKGPYNKKYSYLVVVIILTLIFIFIPIMYMESLLWKIITILTIVLMGFGVCLLYYIVSFKRGTFNPDAHVFKIMEDRIESKQMDRYYVIYADNIKKMKYMRDFGGTGSKIKIWPKDYDILTESGFEFKDYVLEYYKKHGTPVILYPPALSREDKRRLREAIEEFKKKHGIE